MSHCMPVYRSKEEMRAAKLTEALERHEMIPPFDPCLRKNPR